jgi:hypothetical protein
VKLADSAASVSRTRTTGGASAQPGSLQRHHLAEVLAQLRATPHRAVPQRDLLLAGDEIGDLNGQRLHRQRRQFGMPPAGETTSGLLATAKSTRISAAVIPAVHHVDRSMAGGPRSRAAIRVRACRLGNEDPIECHQVGGTSCPSS